MKFNSCASHLIFSLRGLDISLGTDSRSRLFRSQNEKWHRYNSSQHYEVQVSQSPQQSEQNKRTCLPLPFLIHFSQAFSDPVL